jgi:hypothetical protein
VLIITKKFYKKVAKVTDRKGELTVMTFKVLGHFVDLTFCLPTKYFVLGERAKYPCQAKKAGARGQLVEQKIMLRVVTITVRILVTLVQLLKPDLNVQQAYLWA